MAPSTTIPHIATAGEIVKYARPVEWVVEDMLPAGSIVVAAGLPKFGGKTFKAMHLGLQVAVGQPFLGKATNCRRVRYSFLEDGRNRVSRRMQELGIKDGDPRSFTCYVGEAMSFNQQVEEIAQTSDPLLWIIDPLIELIQVRGLDENDSGDMTKLVATLRPLTNDKGHTILIVHHFRKDGLAMRGSGALNGATDGWWDIVHKGENLSLITCNLRDGGTFSIGCHQPHENGKVKFFPRSPEEMPAGPLPAQAHGQGQGRGPVRRSLGDRIVDLLTRSPQAADGLPWTRPAIAEALGVTTNGVKKAITLLVPHVIHRVGLGQQDGYKLSGLPAPAPAPRGPAPAQEGVQEGVQAPAQEGSNGIEIGWEGSK